jgi:hypothetical protein
LAATNRQLHAHRTNPAINVICYVHHVYTASLLQVRFIGSNHVTSHELLSFNVVWLGLQAWELLLWLKARTTTAQFSRAISTTLLTAIGSVVGGVVLLTLTGGGGAGFRVTVSHPTMLRPGKTRQTSGADSTARAAALVLPHIVEQSSYAQTVRHYPTGVYQTGGLQF